MKKIIFIAFIILSTTILPQKFYYYYDDSRVNLYGYQTNGTNEYSYITPLNDFTFNDGTELITDPMDENFETGTTQHWNAIGNYSITGVTTSQFKNGSNSLEISVTGSGDSSSNYVYLDVSNIGNLVTGTTYTLQFWVRTTSTCTLYCYVGDQPMLKQYSDVSISPLYGVNANTWTKIACDFTYQGKKKIKIYLSGVASATLFLDWFSFTKAYSAIVNIWFYPFNSGTIFSTRENGGNGVFINYDYDTPTKKITITIYDNQVPQSWITTAGTNIEDSTWHLLTMVWDKFNSQIKAVKTYIDGTLIENRTYNASSFGRFDLSFAKRFFFGGSNYVPNAYYKWITGELQIIKFEGDLTQYISYVAANYNRGKNGQHLIADYPTGNIVGWWKWEGATYTDMMKNSGTSAVNATGVNMDISNQIVKTSGYK